MRIKWVLQIALKTLSVQIPENCDTLDKVTHLDHYKYCRASFMNEVRPTLHLFKIIRTSYLTLGAVRVDKGP